MASPSKLGILIDSSRGYFDPKMKMLQRELPGKNRSILYRDPAEQRDHFAQVLGERLGEFKFWQMPLEVETRLFTDGQFVEATQQSLFLLRPDFPLLYARIKQLRGELDEAVHDYVSFRLNPNVPMVLDKKKVIPRSVQQGLDVYATYYLGLAHLERNNLQGAEDMFLKLLQLLPEPGPSLPYYHMFRWGAHANLGRIYEAKGERQQAIAHYSQADPTMQYHGNLLRARELLWQDPMAPPADPLPPAPKEFSTVASSDTQTAKAAQR
jgi:tetratricopeptide (TPR) repeat protein